MEFLKKMFGQKLINWIIFLVVGIILVLAPIKKDLTQEQVGYFIIFISVLAIIYEARLRYYIKFRKNDKEVRSSGEKFIEEYLKQKKLAYVYEKPIKLVGEHLPFKPDFWLPEFDVYVEYWGKWYTDFEYRKECRHKKEIYNKNEIKLIELYPDNIIRNGKFSISQLDWKFTERLLNILKKERS